MISPSSDRLRDRLGRPMHDLRISVTDRCNLRCTYCMPADKFGEHHQFLPRAELLSFEEIARVAAATARLGVCKLRITGGEPLLRKELPELVQRLSAIPGIQDIALTTNGLLLPEHAVALKSAGLNRLTVSLDSLDEAVFGAMNGRRATVQKVLAGIDAAEAAGFRPIKINVVVQRGVNDHTLLDLVRHFRGTGHVPRFIEYMDVGTLNDWELREVLPSRELVARIAAQWPLRAVEPNYPGEVASRFLFEDGAGEIGVISSVSQPFCGGCSRLRLSSDGCLYTCLFASGGTDIKHMLRQNAAEEELVAFLRDVWIRREDRYSEIRAANTVHADRVEMYHVGG